MLKGKTIVVTAGPTHEAIDPVRFIGNHSSGKMGYAIANELAKKGARVHLISGPTHLTPDADIHLVRVQSAQEMYEATLPFVEIADAVILAAAVADYRPKSVSDTKIKKKETEMTLELVKNIDIAKTLGANKKSHQVFAGFALETNNELENAKSKLESKNFDFIILNSLQKENQVFGSDYNKITILDHNKHYDFEFKPKHEVAKDIVSFLEKKLS